MEFATEIGQSLLTEVRRLQNLLSKAEEALSVVRSERDALEIGMKQVEESVDRYKEENWNLEVAAQELRSQLSETAGSLQKSDVERVRTTKELGATRNTLESTKAELGSVKAELEKLKTKHDTDLASMRKMAAGLQRDKSDLQSVLDGTKNELESERKKLRVGRKSGPFEDLAGAAALRGDGEGSLDEEEGGMAGDDHDRRKSRRKTGEAFQPPSPSAIDYDDEFSHVPDAPDDPTSNASLRSSLAHAQRTIATLRNALGREKETRKRLEMASVDSSGEESTPVKRAAPGGRGRGTQRRRGAWRAVPSKLAKEVAGSDTSSEEGEEMDNVEGTKEGGDDEEEEDEESPDAYGARLGIVDPAHTISRAPSIRGLSSSMVEMAEIGIMTDPVIIVDDKATLETVEIGIMTDSVEEEEAVETMEIGTTTDPVEEPAVQVAEMGTATDSEPVVEMAEIGTATDAVEVEPTTHAGGVVALAQPVEESRDIGIEAATSTDPVELPISIDGSVQTTAPPISVDHGIDAPDLPVAVDASTQSLVLAEADASVQSEEEADTGVPVPVSFPALRTSDSTASFRTATPARRSLASLEGLRRPPPTESGESGDEHFYTDIDAVTVTDTVTDGEFEDARDTWGRRTPTPTTGRSTPTFATPTRSRYGGDSRDEGEVEVLTPEAIRSGTPLSWKRRTERAETPDKPVGVDAAVQTDAVKEHLAPSPALQADDVFANRQSVGTFGFKTSPRISSSAFDGSSSSGPTYIERVSHDSESMQRPDSAVSGFSDSAAGPGVDRSRPPQLSMPPPPSVPPPVNLEPRKSIIRAAARPSSPPPPELLRRAHTPVGSVLSLPGEMPPPPQPRSVQSARSLRRPSLGPHHPVSDFGVVSILRPPPTAPGRFNTVTGNMSVPSMSRRQRGSSSAASMSSVASSRTSEPTMNEGPQPPLPGAAGEATPGSSSDPVIIQAITQTMIGEFLFKYTRRKVTKGISEKRHQRFFWVHPYTKTLYWSSSDPGAQNVDQSSAKSGRLAAFAVAVKKR
jgi:hypothetical protein